MSLLTTSMECSDISMLSSAAKYLVGEREREVWPQGDVGKGERGCGHKMKGRG